VKNHSNPISHLLKNNGRLGTLSSDTTTTLATIQNSKTISYNLPGRVSDSKTISYSRSRLPESFSFVAMMGSVDVLMFDVLK
jgi:hypothetical protein